MDTLHGAQSTIIEYPKHLVVIEVPINDAGGGQPHDLTENENFTTNYLNFLTKSFPNKPVKYILSSHWHQHSLSGVSPFTKNGTKIVTTKLNWDYAIANGLIEQKKLPEVTRNIIKISKDTTFLADTEIPIKILYIDSTYKNKPTKDYLFFYLPKQSILHASCMTAVGNSDFSKIGNYVYHERLTDLNRAITERKLNLKYVIRLGREEIKNESFEPGIYDYKKVEKYIKNGRSPVVVMEPFINLSTDIIKRNQDSIYKAFIDQDIPHFCINKAVYTCIKEGQFEKAVLFAKLLNIYYPGILTFIDSMGEAYFVNGELEIAKHISKLLFEYDPKWSGGIKIWEENKKSKNY